MRRRSFIKAGAALGVASTLPPLKAQEVVTHNWENYDFGPGPQVADRLNQGPFGIEQDAGWYTILVTSQSTKPVKNYGLGLMGYTWEEGGPSLAARAGTETLEQHVEKLASLPFVDVLYIRCDWRDVQTAPGKLQLHPVFPLTIDAAKRHNLRVAFRIQMSNTEGQPGRLALPDFLQKQVPLVKIGKTYGAKSDFVEPRYDHPRFRSAFKELNELLVQQFDQNPLIEFVDLMMYGFWGEGHTSNLRGPFPDYLTASRICVFAVVAGCAPTASSLKNRFRSKNWRTARPGWQPSWRTVITGNTKWIPITCPSTKPASTYSRTGCCTQSISARTTGRSGPSLTICGVTTSVIQTVSTRCGDGSVIACGRRGSGNGNDMTLTRS